MGLNLKQHSTPQETKYFEKYIKADEEFLWKN